MRIADVDFPEPFLNALRDGRLVVFAGAGISMGPPANLPDFPKLARQIAEGTGLSIGEGEPEDRFLGRVKAAGPNVHQIAAQRLQQNDPQPKGLHRDLLRLYRRTEDIRIVTTNFDPLLEEAAGSENPKVSNAPALPLGQRFQGIVHIHGSVSEPEEMVLTSQDFGRAYLTEGDGWARRFLVDLFASHTVLFVGYSHNDTIMTYLTPSMPRDGAARRYALIGNLSDEPERWRNMGIEPITFPQEGESDYTGLGQAVEGLANYIQRGILDWQQQIKRIASGPPPLEEESAGVIEHALTNPVYTRFFVEAAESSEWIAWLNNRNYLDALFSHGELNEQQMMLSAWLRRFAVKEPGSLFSLVERHGSRINRHLWNMIAWQMGQASDPLPDPETLSRWVHFLTSAIPPTFNEALLDDIAENCAVQGLLVNVLQIYDVMTASRPQANPRFAQDNSSLDNYRIQLLWEKCLKPNLPEVAESLLEKTVWRLEERHSLVTAWDGEYTLAGSTFHRPAIETHEQNKFPDATDMLVDIVRDCLEWLSLNRPDTVKAWSERHSRTPHPMLRRLAVHILPDRTDLSADEKIAWLLERYDVNERPAKHEIFRAVACVYLDASLKSRKSLIDSVLSYRWPIEDDPDIDRRTAYHNLEWLHWLNNAASDCPIAKAALDNLKSEYLEFQPSEHPDFEFYWFEPYDAIEKPSRWNLQEVLNTSPSEWLVQALKEQPEGYLRAPLNQTTDVAKEATKEKPSWGLDLAAEMIRREEWETHIWQGVFRGLQETELDADSLTKAVQTISRPELVARRGHDVAYALSKLVVNNRSVTNPATLQLANSEARKLWQSVPSDDRTPGTDWLNKAINHQGGYLAEFWIQSIATWREHQELAPTALSSEYQEALAEIMTNRGLPGKLARVVLFSRISFLISADEEWTKRNLIPLLAHNHDEFESAWDGVTYSSGFTPRAAELLKEPLLQAAEHINDGMTAQTRSRFIGRYTAMLTWFVSGPNDQWLTKLLAGSGQEVRQQFSREIGRLLHFLDESTQKQWWDTWIRGYWENRLIGAPAPLGGKEIEAMIEWTTSLTAVYPEAVELAIQMPTVPMERSILISQLNDSDIPAKHAESVARLLIHISKAGPSYSTWYRARPLVEELLQRPLDEDTKTGLQEILVKFNL